MRRLPWRSVVRGDRKTALTSVAVAVVSTFAFAGFALVGALGGEGIEDTGRFAGFDTVVFRTNDPSAVWVGLYDVELASGARATLATLDGPGIAEVPSGVAWTQRPTGGDVVFANGIVLRATPAAQDERVALDWLVVGPSDLRAIAAGAPPILRYALLDDANAAADVVVPGVGPFFEASEREVSRDLALVVVFACVLVAFFAYEFIRSDVRERRSELAVWRSLGMRRREVVRLVCARGTTIAVLGVAVAIATTHLAILRLGATISISGLAPPPPVTTAVVAFAIVLAATLGSLPPALSAGRLEIRETMEEQR